eukprot:scaffold545_cov26-Tisochrysis_lutea.AAC.1
MMACSNCTETQAPCVCGCQRGRLGVWRRRLLYRNVDTMSVWMPKGRAGGVEEREGRLRRWAGPRWLAVPMH